MFCHINMDKNIPTKYVIIVLFKLDLVLVSPDNRRNYCKNENKLMGKQTKKCHIFT